MATQKSGKTSRENSQIDKAYQQCSEILTRDADKLNQIVEFLLKHETMSGVQFMQGMKGEEISENSSSNLFDEFQSKTEE